MKLKEYYDSLTKILKENPKAKDLIVVYAADDERNRYSELYFTPSIGKFEDSDFTSIGNEDYEEIHGKKKPNSICIN